MIRFNSDYTEGAHPRIMRRLMETNMEQTPGYGEDEYCREAAALIRDACLAPEAAVHFLVGGTQTNLTVIDAALRSHQAVLCADTAHVHVHETGSIEACGHKLLVLPGKDGKITAEQVEEACRYHQENTSREHMAQPKLVYISSPTELGTLYNREELTKLHEVCRRYRLYLFLDGARLAYGLCAPGNDLTLPELARLCDVFYIGGTKVGALFGEAVVITSEELKEDFRYLIKQHGGMLAKGRLLGIQFKELFTGQLYEEMGQHAVDLAMKLKQAFQEAGYPLLIDSPTNQQFVILPDAMIASMGEKFAFEYQQRVDGRHSAIRLCTSWATREEDVDKLIRWVRARAK